MISLPPFFRRGRARWIEATTPCGNRHGKAHKGERIYLLVNQPDPAPYLAALALVAKGKARLKEVTYLGEVLSGLDWAGRTFEHPTCAWWDIKNDWIAVLGEDRAKAVQAAINEGPH